MKNCLLTLAVVGAMVVGAPAYSQYVFIDVNGDGENSVNPFNPYPPYLPWDYVGPQTKSIDIYFVTDKNPDGTASVCAAEPAEFKINSYEFILRYSGSGSVHYGAWTDNMGYANGGVLCGDNIVCQGGADVWIAKYKFTYDPPGKYKIGSLAITVTGTPQLDFASSSTLDTLAATSFGSSCSGNQGDHTIRLGSPYAQPFPGDFIYAFGTTAPIPVTSTTWGKIKKTYQ